MTDLDTQAQSSDSAIIRLWQRIPVVVRAILSGFIVFEVGSIAGVGSMISLPAPWSLAVIGGVLWLYWKYFSGSWWPKTTRESRENCFRALKLPGVVWKWGLIAAMLLVAVWQSGLVVTFRIMEFPHEAFTSQYNLDAAPLWLAWLFVGAAALVAGITEEVGFRGYMQVPLEKSYGPIAGITIVSVMFLLLHLNQTWAPPILFHLFALSVAFGVLVYATDSLIPGIISHTALDVFNFSYWWSDVAGRFGRQTIFDAGLDAHFIIWCLVFGASATLFIVMTRKILLLRKLT